MNRTLESALRSKYNFRKQCSRRKRTSCLLRAILNFFHRKKIKECVLLKQTMLWFFFFFAYVNFFLFSCKKSCKYTEQTLRKCNLEKMCKNKNKENCHCKCYLCVFFTSFQKRVIRDIRRYIAIENF
jgi:hypothetical protein